MRICSLVSLSAWLLPLHGRWVFRQAGSLLPPPIPSAENPVFTLDRFHITLDSGSSVVRCVYDDMGNATLCCSEFRVVRASIFKPPKLSQIRLFHSVSKNGVSLRVAVLERGVRVWWVSGGRSGDVELVRADGVADGPATTPR